MLSAVWQQDTHAMLAYYCGKKSCRCSDATGFKHSATFIEFLQIHFGFMGKVGGGGLGCGVSYQTVIDEC